MKDFEWWGELLFLSSWGLLLLVLFSLFLVCVLHDMGIAFQ